MTRTQISLDGDWDFAFCGQSGAPAAETAWRAITVPGPWQAQFDDLRMSSGTAWYRRLFAVPNDWTNEPVFLHFGAVNYHAQVWLNGSLVGEHEGGFLPFEFAVGAHLRAGSVNEISVRVVTPTDDPAAYPDYPFSEIPFGKQSWYGPLGGIWQSVQLERRAACHVERIRLVPDLRDGTVQARIDLAGVTSRVDRIALEIHGPDGQLVCHHGQALPQDGTSLDIGFSIAEPAAWSPDAPNLYRFTATLVAGDRVCDERAETFGFRTIEARAGRLWLNGQPLYLRGALDQDYYPDTICTPPSLAFLEDQLVKAKQLGLNCLRCHIKVPDPRYYEVADRLGMLVWTELPNSGRLTAAARDRLETTLRAIVDRDGNHPSIIAWTIINENWGTDLVHDPDHRAWLKRTFAWLKAYDPTRLVVDNSPLAPSMHVQSDIEDFHFYSAIPDHRREWDLFVDGLAARGAATFSTHGDAVRTGEEPLIVSEFGNWGLPDPAALAGSDGKEPWWFETGHDWGDGVMYPHGVQNRFRDFHLDRVFGSFQNFVEAAQWQQFRAFKYEIETMRRRPELAGYVITELTDCHWESNGLMDMRRNKRVFHDSFATFNADTVIIPSWDRVTLWEGETTNLNVSIAHGAGAPIVGARLEIALGVCETVAVPDLAAGEVRALPPVRLIAPVAGEPRVVRISLVLRSAEGACLATNHVELSVHPRRAAAVRGDARLWSPDPEIRDRLSMLGYALADGLRDAAVVVAEQLDAAYEPFVRAGGALLFLANQAASLNPFFPHWQNVRVQSREGTQWRGDWASSFSWLKRSGLFATLPGGPLLDHGFDRVIPKHVIVGCNLVDFQARVHAGLMVGWVHKPVALIVERQYAEGRMVASSFRLFNDPVGADPTATLLLDGLIDLALGQVQAQPAELPEAIPVSMPVREVA